MPLLDGKVVVVTGGGSGIGQAACHLYAREGAREVVSDIDETGGNETVRAIQKMSGDAILSGLMSRNRETATQWLSPLYKNTDSWTLLLIMLVSAVKPTRLRTTVLQAGKR